MIPRASRRCDASGCALLGKAPAAEVAVAVVAAVGGVVVLATGCVGYLVRPLSWACGSVLVLAAVLALFCAGGPTRALGAVGLAAGLLLVLWEWAIARPSRRAYVQPGPERPATREIR